MKANETPERIYCESDGLSNIVKVHNIKWPDDEAENIEYTRTDAFIEKAENYLRNKCQRFILTEKDIEDFVKFMKGE